MHDHFNVNNATTCRSSKRQKPSEAPSCSTRRLRLDISNISAFKHCFRGRDDDEGCTHQSHWQSPCATKDHQVEERLASVPLWNLMTQRCCRRRPCSVISVNRHRINRTQVPAVFGRREERRRDLVDLRWALRQVHGEHHPGSVPSSTEAHEANRVHLLGAICGAW